MKDKHYIPHPIDTSDIELPESLITLGEQLAKNVHEVWAARRMAEGWTWGPERNDAAKKHPCLIPYEELSEQERDYDRHTAQETLRFIMKMGGEIRSNVTIPNHASTCHGLTQLANKLRD